MKKVILLFLVLFSFTIFAKDFSVTPKVNLSALSLMPGIGAGFNTDYSITKKLNIELDANFSYYFTQLLWDELVDNMWSVPITVGVKYNFNETFALFGGAGITVFHFESSFGSDLESIVHDIFSSDTEYENHIDKYNTVKGTVSLGCEIKFANNLSLRPKIDLVTGEDFYIIPFVRLELGYTFDF